MDSRDWVAHDSHGIIHSYFRNGVRDPCRPVMNGFGLMKGYHLDEAKEGVFVTCLWCVARRKFYDAWREP